MKSITRQFADLNGTVLPGNLAAGYLSSTAWYSRTTTVLCFLSCGTEISTTPIISQALKDHKKIAVPKVIPGTNQMEFFYLKDIPLEQQIQTGAFGICEPKTTLEKVNPKDLPQDTLVVLPGLAFTRTGTRLGKGKGFYDRFLSETQEVNPGFKESAKFIGMCYSAQIVQDLPSQEHDIKVHGLVTEKEFFCI
ncbi:MAG: 5-formyltetrahydrofolate cyclo-ligase [Treponema sp.]|nr:5-formyltetrahydrofolate cyclo-ligase [Treponema sp.]